MDERQIILAIQNRDETGLEELILHYSPLFHYIVAPIVTDPHDREECVSEISLRVWDKIDQYDPHRGSWTGWLTAIARNTALNKIRSQSTQNLKTSDLSDLDEVKALPSKEPSPEEQVLRAEQKAALAKVIDNLPHGDRLLFYRKYYYQQSTAQIASELGMTERAVEGRLYRLKQKLRKKLEGGVFHD
ncbi:MAG: sigma-70 family RNA polymerase sigma factor [Firmicutes bacterium]|nr:sigma-70 family RNA polymerase sigma factor [Bacillota bacterium]